MKQLADLEITIHSYACYKEARRTFERSLCVRSFTVYYEGHSGTSPQGELEKLMRMRYVGIHFEFVSRELNILSSQGFDCSRERSEICKLQVDWMEANK